MDKKGRNASLPVRPRGAGRGEGGVEMGEKRQKDIPKDHPNAHESVKSKLVKLVKVVRTKKGPLREEKRQSGLTTLRSDKSGSLPAEAHTVCSSSSSRNRNRNRWK